jgi:hypothetical protein
LLTIGVLLAAVPAAAQELRQTPGSHITVDQCNAHRHAGGSPGHAWIDPYGRYHGMGNFPYYVGFLAIEYVNEARKPAKEVDFGLVSRGSLIALAKDVGTFSSGARIAHEFSIDPEAFPIGTAFPYCAVMRVKYADGTEWRNPNPPQP